MSKILKTLELIEISVAIPVWDALPIDLDKLVLKLVIPILAGPFNSSIFEEESKKETISPLSKLCGSSDVTWMSPSGLNSTFTSSIIFFCDDILSIPTPITDSTSAIGEIGEPVPSILTIVLSPTL